MRPITNEDLDERLRRLEEQRRIDGDALNALANQARVDGASLANQAAKLQKIERALFDENGKSVLTEMLKTFQGSRWLIGFIFGAAPVIGAIIGAMAYFKVGK